MGFEVIDEGAYTTAGGLKGAEEGERGDGAGLFQHHLEAHLDGLLEDSLDEFAKHLLGVRKGTTNDE